MSIPFILFSIKQGEAADSEKELEREAALKQSLEKLEEKSKEVAVLETRVKELEQKLKLAEAALLDKVSFYQRTLINQLPKLNN